MSFFFILGLRFSEYYLRVVGFVDIFVFYYVVYRLFFNFIINCLGVGRCGDFILLEFLLFLLIDIFFVKYVVFYWEIGRKNFILIKF